MPVTDPELLKKLEAHRLGEPMQTDAPSPGVTDPDLLKKLEAHRLKHKSQELGNTEKVESALPEGSVIGDALRTAATLGTSIVAEPVSGIAGIANFVAGGDASSAADAVASSREALTYTPGTAGSQENLQSFSEVMQPVAEAFETVSSTLGDVTYEWTGSPELAAAAYSLPTAALELIGVKGLRGIKRLGDVELKAGQKAALLDPEMKYSGAVADVKLTKAGDVVPDKVGKKLLENGINRNEAAVITNSNKMTKGGMNRMVSIFEQGKGNSISSMTNRTTKVIGDSVAKRLQYLQGRRRGLGKNLDNLVKGEVGSLGVDISDSLRSITHALNSEGIKPVITKGKVHLPPGWHKGSVFELSKMAPAKRAVEDVYKAFEMTSNLGKTNVKMAHKLKKNLDQLIDATKLAEAGVPNNIIRDIAVMRKSVNDSLSSIESYRAINADLGRVINGMSPFEKYLKPGTEWADAKVSGVVGEAMKGLSANSRAAVELVDDLSSLDKTLSSMGIYMGDDPRALVQFRQTLLDNFNVEPTMPKAGGGTAAGGLLISASVGNTFGAAHDVGRLIRAGFTKSEAAKMAKQKKAAFNAIKMAVSQGR